MNVVNIFLGLALIYAPSAERLPSITETKQPGGLGCTTIVKSIGANIQLANKVRSHSLISQFPSDLLLGGIDGLRIDLSLDGFGIKPMYFHGNSSFIIVCEFEIGIDSHPTSTCLLAGEMYVDMKAIKAGLAKWTFRGLEPKKKCVLVLNWEHNKGYVLLSLFCDQMNLSLRLPKNP